MHKIINGILFRGIRRSIIIGLPEGLNNRKKRLVDFAMLVTGEARLENSAIASSVRVGCTGVGCSSTSMASYHGRKYLAAQISVCENKHAGYCSTVAFHCTLPEKDARIP